VAWAFRRRSISPPRSSNQTCGFSASGSPTGFTARPTAWSKMHADEGQDAKVPEHDLGWKTLRAPPLHLATMDEEVADAVVDIVVDRSAGPQPGEVPVRDGVEVLRQIGAHHVGVAPAGELVHFLDRVGPTPSGAVAIGPLSRSASKIGSTTSFAAVCPTRSRMVGMPSGRSLPPGFGIIARRTGRGR